MEASDFIHALTIAWYHEPCLPDPSTVTSEVFDDIAILRDLNGHTLALVNLITDTVIFNRSHLRQFDHAVANTPKSKTRN
jgi:inorganic pyrophosphatase/exopolyphosphatase